MKTRVMKILGSTKWLLLLLLLALPVGAQSNFTYTVNIDGTVTLTGYSGSASDLTIPSTYADATVTGIASAAFWTATTVAIVNVPTNVINIEEEAFATAGGGMDEINVDPANPVYSSLNGVLFDKTQTTLLEFPGNQSRSYVIPAGVTSISDTAFSDCYNVTNITIPAGVASIGYYAFGDCINLTSLIIPDSVTNIGTTAFQNCGSLAKVSIGAGLTSIPAQAFQYCSDLTNVTIGNNVTNIGRYAFQSCARLKRVYFLGNSPLPTNDLTVFSGDTDGIVYYQAGTTGWGAFFDGLPTWNPQAQTGDASFGVRNNQFRFNISGNSNLVVVVEACTNLANPVWLPVSTNTLIGGTNYFSDPQWTNYPERFYRFRSP